MARRGLTALAGALLVLVGPRGVVAQDRPSLEVTLPAPAALGQEGPTVRVRNVLGDRAVRELLRSGFPARLHFRADLWSAGGGWFNSLLKSAEWEVVVRYDALRENYEAVRVINDLPTPMGRYAQFADVVAEIESPFRAPITPVLRRGSQYYNVSLELEIFSVSDLDELERWLRGELRPAVRGQSNPGTALGRGMKTLLVRILGGESRRLEERSKTFRYEGRVKGEGPSRFPLP